MIEFSIKQDLKESFDWISTEVDKSLVLLA